MNKPLLNLPIGYPITHQFTVKELLGAGWEGEVYRVEEKNTGIERVAKVFYPQRNLRNKAINFYAKKLYKLRNCSILIRYLSQEQFYFGESVYAVLLSDFVDGVPLEQFLQKQPGRRLLPFQALHLLHALAKGIEDIHLNREYHGDLHSENIIVQRFGLGFDLKLIDMYHWGRPSRENYQYDLECLIRIFYDALGGKKYYPRHPDKIKQICCGLRKDLIRKKFKSMGQLRTHLENLDWSY